MSKSQAIAFFEEISKNNQLAQEVKKVVGGKNSDEAKAKELLSLAKTKGFNFTQEDAASAKGALKVSFSPKDMLEVSGGAGPKSSIMALTLLAGLGVGGAALTNMEASAMKPNHQQASPQTQTEFMKDSGTARFDPHYTTTYFDDNPTYFGDDLAYFGDNSAYLGDNSAYFDERPVMLPAPSLYDEQHQDGAEPASEMSFDEDFEEDDEMESPSELNLAPEATQEQSQRIPYVFLNYNDENLYQGDISETLDAYGATARIAALWDGINCTLKLYGPEWGLDDSSFLLNFDISESAVRGGTGLLIVSPGNTGLLIHFKVQKSSFRDRILLWFEKVDGEVKVPDNWGILSIDSSSYSTPQLFLVKGSKDIFFPADFCEKDKMMLKNLYATYLSTDWTDNDLYDTIYCFLGAEIRDSKNPYLPINTEDTKQICDTFSSIETNYKTLLQDVDSCTYIHFKPEKDLSITKYLKEYLKAYRITVNTKTELDTLKILHKLVEVFMTKQNVSNYISSFKGLLTTLDSQPLITNSMLIKYDKIVIYFYDNENLEVKQEILNLIKDSGAEISPSMSAFYQIGLYEDKAANDPYNHGIGFGREPDRSSFTMTRTKLIINALNEMTQLDITQQTEDAFINNVKLEFLKNGINPQTPHLQDKINGYW